MPTEPERLSSAIAALESQRTLLGDAVVDAALRPLRAKFAALATGSDDQGPDLRQVTILFLDVVGSTQLSTQLDPEDVHTVMDGALARFTTIVEAHGGKVLQYAGDNLLAVFGVAMSREDDAERAVRCGLALLDEGQVQKMRVRRTHAHDGFDVRVGIHTGSVLLGAADSVDGAGSIRGSAVNVAARMEQLAPPGQLRISQATHALVRGQFQAERQVPAAVKGVDEPMVTYLVRAGAGSRVASRGVSGVETRMVGRDAELQALQQAFGRLAAQRCLMRIHIVGEAGLGKSRLLQEFDTWLLNGAQPVVRLHARATPATQSRPYGMLRDLLVSWLGVADDASAEEARDRFDAAMAPLLRTGDDGDLAQAQAHALGHLIGFDHSASPHVRGIIDDGRQIRQRGFHAAVQALRRLCVREGVPVMLLCDDLHWADEGSLDFLDQLALDCTHLPMAVIGLMRPELFERRVSHGAGIHALRIDLQPLGMRVSAQLADEVLKKLPLAPAALRDALVGRADGNPFFMEELVNMLIDQRVIAIDSGEWWLAKETFSSTAVPPTLAGVLQVRLDHLPIAERRALRHASAIGLTFWDRALDEGAAAALPGLLARGLLHARPGDALEGAQAYAFKHQLLHRVVYDTLLKSERRESHARAAQWLSSLSASRVDEFAAAIGEHHEKAGAAAQARAYYARAAQHARARFAHAQVLALVARALGLQADDGVARRDALAQRWQLLDVQERTLDSLGRRAEQRIAIDGLHEIAEALADDVRRGEVAWRRCDIALRTSDFEATQRWAQEALRLAARQCSVELLLRAQHRLAAALRALGDVAGGKAAASIGLTESRARAAYPRGTIPQQSVRVRRGRAGPRGWCGHRAAIARTRSCAGRSARRGDHSDQPGRGVARDRCRCRGAGASGAGLAGGSGRG